MTHPLFLSHTCILGAYCLMSQRTYSSFRAPAFPHSPFLRNQQCQTVSNSLFQLNPLYSSSFPSSLGWRCTAGAILGFLGSGRVVLAPGLSALCASQAWSLVKLNSFLFCANPFPPPPFQLLLLFCGLMLVGSRAILPSLLFQAFSPHR